MEARTTNFVTGDAAFAVDKDGVIVLWNSAAEKEFGYPADAALGQRCWKLLSGKDVFGNRYCCEHCPLREMASRNESVHGFKLSFKTAHDGEKEFSLNSLLVYGNGGGGQLLHICHSTDITDNYLENGHKPAYENGHKATYENGHKNARIPPINRNQSLTNRELEVLEHLADGKTTHEIARIMFISIATVRNHVQHILKKLHVHNRLEAVVMGQRIELI